jgi:uncharacterized protein
MSQNTAFSAVDYIEKNHPLNTGIIFFGGEPLLRKDLIVETIDYCRQKEKTGKAYFHYKVTTNGLLLDDAFLEFAQQSKLQVSLSIDGNKAAHDLHRRTQAGESTFETVREKALLLLKHQPYAKALMTVSPETLPHYCDSVEFLLGLGFKYIIVSLNYAGNWEDHHLKQLKNQYKKLAALYEKYILDEKKFYFSPFEMKLASHIRQENAECYQCHLAQRQISVAHDGRIYPCVQFVKDGVSNTGWSIGNIESGIDAVRQNDMYKLSKTGSDACTSCSYNARCNNKCSCLSYQLTGTLNQVSPVLCETERILIPIVDKLGERLYKKGSAMFIQKHYNVVYPIISMMEDMF